MVGRLRADAEHVDDFLALHLLLAMLRQSEHDAAFLGRQRSGDECHGLIQRETSLIPVFR